MSYILDALKKADAERERGAVPGLHTQAEPLPHDELPQPAGNPTVIWIVAGVSLGAALAMGYALWGRDAPPIERTPAVAIESVRPSMVPAMPARDAVPEPVKQPAYAAAPQPVPAPAPAPAPVERRIEAKSSPTIKASPVPPAKEAASATARPLSVSELPDEIKRELPQLSIGGAMHSDTPSSRMLILSNGVFHEGDQPYPGLVLEEIKLKAAVFRFKGYRYSVNY
jgi:general secretion pathway protein B